MAEPRDIPIPEPAYGAPEVGAYAPPSTAPSQTLSIVSMALGLAGMFFGLLFSIAAVILGHMAQRREPAAKAFWLTGIIAGYVGIAFGLLAIVGVLLYVLLITGLIVASSML